jgi:hypothetical protein
VAVCDTTEAHPDVLFMATQLVSHDSTKRSSLSRVKAACMSRCYQRHAKSLALFSAKRKGERIAYLEQL